MKKQTNKRGMPKATVNSQTEKVQSIAPGPAKINIHSPLHIFTEPPYTQISEQEVGHHWKQMIYSEL